MQKLICLSLRTASQIYSIKWKSCDKKSLTFLKQDFCRKVRTEKTRNNALNDWPPITEHWQALLNTKLEQETPTLPPLLEPTGTLKQAKQALFGDWGQICLETWGLQHFHSYEDLELEAKKSRNLRTSSRAFYHVGDWVKKSPEAWGLLYSGGHLVCRYLRTSHANLQFSH